MKNTSVRVAFITHYTNLHGANRSLMNLIEGLKPLGVDVGVVCPAKGQITDELERLEIPNVILPFADWLSRAHQGRWYRLWCNLKVLPALLKKIREWNADVIYTNSSVTPVGAFAAALLRKPHIWHIREYGLLDYGRRPDWGAAFFRFWLNRTQAVIAISHAVKKEVLKDVHVQTAVVYNGVISATDLGHLKQEVIAGDPGIYTFVMLSQISANKNQEEAIRALAVAVKGHPHIRLLIAGNDRGDYAKRVKLLCEHLGVAGHVSFLG
ncbi:MAG: glycosyltransferase family 4 protein, partial [Candidatus Omnitrophica bacterium]|nr:glycosyltransferase family 4 protein [Candidatus Omnitrophota bacterium]